MRGSGAAEETGIGLRSSATARTPGRCTQSLQLLDIGTISGTAGLFGGDEVIASEVWDPCSHDAAHRPPSPSLLEGHGPGDRQHIDARIVSHNCDRIGGDLGRVELTGDAIRQLAQGREHPDHVRAIAWNEDIDILGGADRPMQVGGHTASKQVASTMLVQQPAHQQDTVIGTKGWSGHVSTARTR